jgi:energy-coupling factor transporter ATP-binding protein EcfA2
MSGVTGGDIKSGGDSGLKHKCPTRLLSDSPASEDAFGSHKRIAEAIAELVAGEDGGKSIALTGPWGSGKSTVVSLLKGLFQDGNGSPKCEVFVFDAWSHQGDPLRRSFLERLIDFLIDKKWVDLKLWHDEKEKLSKRLKITETSEIPHLTSGGIWWAFAALLVPVGLAISQLENMLWQVRWPSSIILSALPLIVGIVLVIIAKVKKCENILRVFVSRGETRTRNETIETPEPTSIEFQLLFDRAIEDALCKHPDRRLLIVIDNLDRVDPHYALALWSTMRTFFDNDAGLSPSCRSRFWLLVPYDPSSLTRLWPATKEDMDDDIGEKDAADFLDAFKRKTFQIQFRVSAPVLSDWKQFFMKHLEEALPQHLSDADIIYRLYRSEGVPKRRPITPRDIKVFLNDLGSLHRQHCGQIPLNYQAIYMLYQESMEKDPKWFANKDFLSVVVRDLLHDDGDWQKYLAALHFNVPREKAMQVVLFPVLGSTLPKGEIDVLAEYANVPALSDHIACYLEENYRDWAENQPEALARAAIVIDKISEAQGEWKQAWRWLSQGAERVSQWRGLNKELAEGISLILRSEGDESRHVDLAGAIVRGVCADPEMKDKEGRPPDQAIIQSWVDGATVLCREFMYCGCQAVMDMFKVPGSANTYLTAVSLIAKNNDAAGVAQFFEPEVGPEQIVSELSSLCQNGTFTHSYSTVVKLMLKVNQEWPWDGLVAALNQRIGTFNHPSYTLQLDELNGCLGSLLVLKHQGNISQAHDTLQMLCQGGSILNHLHNVQSEPSTAAQIVFVLLDNLPAANVIQYNTQYQYASMGRQFYEYLLSQPASYPEIIKHLSATCMQYAKAHVLVNAFKQAEQTKVLVSEVLRHAVLNLKRGEEHFLPAEYLLKEYEIILQLMDDESLEQLIKVLVEYDSLVSRVIDREFSPTNGKLYALAYTVSDNQGRLALDRFLIPALQAFDKMQWHEQLQLEGDFLQIIFSMINAGAHFYLAQSFHDALVDYTQRIINGEITPTQFDEAGRALLKMLDKDWQNTLADNLWDMFERGKDKPLTNLLKLFGDFLLDSNVTEAICDRFVRCWLAGAVERCEAEELRWAADFIEKKPELFERAPDYSRNTFRDRITDRIRRNDTVLPELNRIALAVGISADEIIDENKLL